MAQSTKKSTSKPRTKSSGSGAKKSTGRKTSGSKATSRRTAPAKVVNDNNTRRYVIASALLLLSLFSFIGYFNVDAWLIKNFFGFIKGLIGGGYYILPPALLVAACTLFLKEEKGRSFRVTSAIIAPFFLGALLQLIFSKDIQFSKEIFGFLYKSGGEMSGGGVISGLLAIGLKSAVSVYGAFPVFLLGLLFFSLSGVGLTVPRIIELIRNREPKVYETKAEPCEKKSTRQASSQQETSTAQTSRRKRAIDIPVDDNTVPAEDYKEEKVGFFNIRPRVKTPDQVIGKEESMDIPNTLTDGVKPLSVEEAAAVAGVPVTVTEIKPDSTSGGTVGSSLGNSSSVTAKITHEEVQAETENITKTIEKSMETDTDEYKFPPITLLRTGKNKSLNAGREETIQNRTRLESTIRSFGVNASITDVTRGPTVTRYDLELEQGVKLSKLTNLSGDLALALGVTGVRIAPIPDMISTVGIEVPNKQVSMVYLHDIIKSQAFQRAKSKLSFAIGSDIGGNPVVGNIAKLPHMLIAGTTGSGKSVCMNSLILSILFKATPEEVRLIMIDPKMVELGIYNGIPHLFVPVVTDPKKAAGALQWAVVEMLKRYRLFSEAGVRDLTGYNSHQKSQGEPVMPRVVIVIDELADLMLVASKEVEESICRVAQMGRAAGMHLVIATQRPSADVITGLMKANIPSRIAFAVSSAMESRIILDNSGAEKLIGSGDMLYSPLGIGKPQRIQGAFVSDEERELVINFLKEGTEANYSDDILAEIEKAAEGKSSDGGGSTVKSNSDDPFADYDDLLPQAVDVIFETKQASVSMLQRRLKLGYARAARIVDQMEELGVVGPFEGSKPRKVLITKQQWQEMQTVQGTAPVEDIPSQPDFADYSDTPAEEWKD